MLHCNHIALVAVGGRLIVGLDCWLVVEVLTLPLAVDAVCSISPSRCMLFVVLSPSSSRPPPTPCFERDVPCDPIFFSFQYEFGLAGVSATTKQGGGPQNLLPSVRLF
jgi:hypothetical protein